MHKILSCITMPRRLFSRIEAKLVQHSKQCGGRSKMTPPTKDRCKTSKSSKQVVAVNCWRTSVPLFGCQISQQTFNEGLLFIGTYITFRKLRRVCPHFEFCYSCSYDPQYCSKLSCSSFQRNPNVRLLPLSLPHATRALDLRKVLCSLRQGQRSNQRRKRRKHSEKRI